MALPVRFIINTPLFVVLFCYCTTPLAAQSDNASNNNSLNLFIDCSGCYQDFIRTNLPFVNFMRDQADADIHLLITEAQTGSGGTEYTLKFLGKKRFASLTDELKYISKQSNTDEEERRGLLKFIKIGLLRYILETPLINRATLQIAPTDMEPTKNKKDKWKNWIFDIDVGAEYEEEERQKSYQIEWDFDASKVTEKWKIELELDYDIDKEYFEFEDQEDITSTSNSKSFEGLVAKSLNDHWSAGVTSRIASSTFNNIAWETNLSPTLEYNIFPYHQYSRRELRFQYRLSPSFMQYRDTTIFNKKKELLLQEELELLLEVTQTWGTVSASIEGSHYFHDAQKNRLEFESYIDFRIYKGLSLSLNLDYSIINDQITLSKEELSDEEVILGQKELATSYSLGGSIGISYTFGSIYNNTVNPRF